MRIMIISNFSTTYEFTCWAYKTAIYKSSATNLNAAECIGTILFILCDIFVDTALIVIYANIEHIFLTTLQKWRLLLHTYDHKRK